MANPIPTTQKVPAESVRVKQEELLHQFSALPPELQQQVMDFIAFLQTRYQAIRPIRSVRKIPLSQEPFIGMWQDRPEMEDSTGWVRKIRLEEWREPRA
ncbi:MAG: DUF2281 domain-containing protein [Anaerolineae bacterium]|jgi:hypothetical protein